MEIKLYSLNQVQNCINKNGLEKINLENFISKSRAVLIKGNTVYLTEKDIFEEIGHFDMSDYRATCANFDELLIVSSYEKLLELKKIKKHESIIEHRDNLYKESRYVDNTLDNVENSNVFASIDCEFNRDKITEVGIFVFNRLLGTFKKYHFCERKEIEETSISPFKNPNVLSLTKPYYVEKIEDVMQNVNDILDDVDILVGHAVANDIIRLRKYGVKVKPIIIDTQKIYQKINEEQISLSDGFNYYGSYLSDYLDRELKNEDMGVILDFYTSRYPNFIKDNLSSNIFIHNAFNDAILALFLLNGVLKKEKSYTLINKAEEKAIANELLIDYNSNISKFTNYLKKVIKNDIS
tara:strand:+ start:604 stop:1659 length:1056 start_codon:yes stop_codon:yes gene_type:complete